MNLARLYSYVTDSFPLLAGLPSSTTSESAANERSPADKKQNVLSPVTVRYQSNTFFLGLFMVRKDLRGNGLGRQAFDLWRRVMQRQPQNLPKGYPTTGG